MNNFKTHPISSVLGLMLIIFSGVLLFIPTLYDIPLWGLALMAVSGILWLRAEDEFISILTFGLSTFVKGVSGKKSISAKLDTGDHPDPNKEEK